MELNEYQKEIAKHSLYKEITSIGGLLYTTLNLSSECGSFVNKIKKVIEEKNGKIHPDDKSILVQALGDVLMCVSQIADELYITLDDVALINLQKLAISIKEELNQNKENES